MVLEVRIGFPVGSNYWREHRGLLGLAVFLLTDLDAVTWMCSLWENSPGCFTLIMCFLYICLLQQNIGFLKILVHVLNGE